MMIAGDYDCGIICLQFQVSSIELMEGDTIVTGSDGLFDNVFDHEIVSTLARYRNVAEAGMCFQYQQILWGISNSAHNIFSF